MPEKFNRYEIREELGVGGMATVYRAYDPLFEREVAVKVLKRELLEDTQLRERFERETKIIARLEHAAIVPVYDVGHDNKQLFYVMRYMTGGSLSERIQAGLSLSEIAYIVLRMATALDYAHNKGIVHRDLKPGNILFDDNNNPYISDFGIAKIAQAATRITSSGIIGTPRYMSPEQARGEEADGRSDLYSLGIMVFEMLSGHSPFEATTPLAMAYKHATEVPPSILTINPDLPQAIDAVLQKALAKRPDDRYNNCAEFSSAFFEVFPYASSPEANFITPPPPRAHVIAATPTELPLKQAAEPPQPKLRNWTMTGGLFLVALIIFSVWGYFGLNQGTTASTPTPETVMPTTVLASPTVSPTSTFVPTETATPTTFPTTIPGIGGADLIALTANNNNLYMIGTDGRNIRQLTNNNIPKFDLQWLLGGSVLLYGEGKCVYQLDATGSDPKPEKIVCFNDARFDGFRVSPDGKNVAISIERRLIVLPFDPNLLSTVKSAYELQNSESVCLDYSDVAVTSAQWSADGKSLAITYQSVIGQRIGDTIRVMSINLQRCQAVDPLITNEIPGRHLTLPGYETYPILPSYSWDGNQRILFNSFKRNAVYGDLYLYNMSTFSAEKIDPIRGVCCYQGAIFSPDGTYILLFFQDEALGSQSETQMYYIPVDQIGMDATFTPIRLPLHFFPNPRGSIEAALHSVVP